MKDEEGEINETLNPNGEPVAAKQSESDSNEENNQEEDGVDDEATDNEDDDYIEQPFI